MEQSKYLLQTRGRLTERPELGPRMLHAISVPSSLYYAESWEERAFAEDSAGLLGGCTWPPRSYTCSFCRREFRSAQALGGHMNVHRRDRARLKQSSSSGSEGTTTTDHDHHRNPCKGMNTSDTHQIISLALDAEPTSKANNYTSTPMQSSLSSNNLVSPSFSSSETQEKHVQSNCEARKNINPRHELLKLGENLTMKEADYDMPRNLCRDDEAKVSTKRQRIGGTLPFSAVTTATSSIQIERPAEVLTLIPSAVDELDLELRLGCSSNYKAVVCLSN